MEANVLKNRDGKVGTALINFDFNTMDFCGINDSEHVKEEQW